MTPNQNSYHVGTIKILYSVASILNLILENMHMNLLWNFYYMHIHLKPC